MEGNAQKYLQKLLPLFHHSPTAMAEINGQGAIRQVNPKAIQLLMPLAAHLSLPGDNLLDVLKGFLPFIGPLISSFKADTGLIIDQEPYRIRFTFDQSLIERHFSLTIEKTAPDSFLVFFDDVTDFLLKADVMRSQP